MDASSGWMVVLAAAVGALAGIAGQLVTAHFTSQNERRRLAIDAGFREWETLLTHEAASGRGADVFPPVLFVYFNNELIRLIDSSGGLTLSKYEGLIKRKNALRDLIGQDSDRRQAELAAQGRKGKPA